MVHLYGGCRYLGERKPMTICRSLPDLPTHSVRDKVCMGWTLTRKQRHGALRYVLESGIKSNLDLLKLATVYHAYNYLHRPELKALLCHFVLCHVTQCRTCTYPRTPLKNLSVFAVNLLI